MAPIVDLRLFAWDDIKERYWLRVGLARLEAAPVPVYRTSWMRGGMKP